MTATTLQLPTNTAKLPRYGPAVWFAIRRDYITGIYSTVPAAAKAHGVMPRTAQERSKDEHWSILRQAYWDRQNAKVTAAPPDANVQPPPAPPETQIHGDSRIARLDQQIARLNDLIDSESDPKSLDKLTASLIRLEDRKRILLGIPLPGSQRPTRKPGRPMPNRDLGAVEADPQPNG